MDVTYVFFNYLAKVEVGLVPRCCLPAWPFKLITGVLIRVPPCRTLTGGRLVYGIHFESRTDSMTWIWKVCAIRCGRL